MITKINKAKVREAKATETPISIFTPFDRLVLELVVSAVPLIVVGEGVFCDDVIVK